MNIYIWDLSQWAPRYIMLTVVEQAVSVSLPVECRSALCLILITGSTVYALLFSLLPFSLCPLQNSSILLDITLLGSSLSPTQVSSLRHFLNLPLACLLSELVLFSSFSCVHLCPFHYYNSNSPVLIILLSAELNTSLCLRVQYENILALQGSKKLYWQFKTHIHYIPYIVCFPH